MTVRSALSATLGALIMAQGVPTHATPSARWLSPPPATAPALTRTELRLSVQATFENPYDPKQVDLWAEVSPPAPGKPFRVNGFHYLPCSRVLTAASEAITVGGPSEWRVRFAPDRPGRWRVVVSVRDASGEITIAPTFLRVTPSRQEGFIRRSGRNPRGFAYDSGKPYVAIGENVCWPSVRGTADYELWFSELSRAGGNFARVWMSSWNTGLEWSAQNRGDWRSGSYDGVGRYAQDNAWKLDRILEIAEQHGIGVMLCFGTFGEFTAGGYFNEGQWKGSAYNAANGGPCAQPGDFWTSSAARELYRRRLRYIAARWGYSTSIHSWEFWNETNAPATWVREMAGALRACDPHRHLITTTYGDPAVWRIPEVDFTQSHHYGSGSLQDSGPPIADDAAAAAVFGKPHLMGEFGIDYRGPDSPYDPRNVGVNLHNGLWSSLMAGNAGGAMSWWWDAYLHQAHRANGARHAPSTGPANALLAHIAGLRRFADSVDWNRGAWRPISLAPVWIRGSSAAPADLELRPGQAWTKDPHPAYFIDPDGIRRNAALPSFLYAPSKPELRTRPVLTVRCARPSRFALRVDSVSTRSVLRISLDGRPAAERTFLADPPSDPAEKPLYVSTERNKEYGNYVARFDTEVSIELPAGVHAIGLDNADGDWLSIDRYTLTAYSSGDHPRTNTLARSSCDTTVLWIHNALSTWAAEKARTALKPISGATSAALGLPGGVYRVQWWDSWRGQPLRQEVVRARSGRVPLRLPVFEHDLAAVLTRLRQED